MNDRELLESILAGQVVLMANLLRAEMAKADPSGKYLMAQFIPDVIKSLKQNRESTLEALSKEFSKPKPRSLKK